MRIVVTGAAGLAGYHVVGALRGTDAVVMPATRKGEEGTVALDLTRPETIAALPPFDVVVNCAGLTPNDPASTWEQYRAINVDAVDALAREAARRGAMFVQISTMGRLRGARARRRSMYVVSKRLAERCLRAHAQRGLHVWILRAAAMYGERDRGNVSRLIVAIARRRLVYPGGDQRKCLLYAGKLGEAVAAGLTRDLVEEQRYRAEYVSFGSAHRFDDIVRTIEELTNGTAWRLPIPRPVVDAGLRSAMQAGRRLRLGRLVDLATAATVALTDVECSSPNVLDRLGIERMPIAEGLRREVEWLRASGRIR